MKDVVTSGTGTRCKLDNVTVAGKTGTTSDYNDVWFSGFTPYYTATAWAGYDHDAKLKSDAEHNLAKTMWKQVMSRVHEGFEDKPFPTPSGIVTATVCSRSGKLPIGGLCDGCLKTEYFEEGTVPTATCDVHYAGIICAYDNLPACENCPFKVEGVFELPLPEDPAVAKGSGTITADGTVVQTGARGTIGEDGVHRCSHDALFFADPNHEAIIAQQSWEMQAAAEAAAAAAAQAAENPESTE
jgi:penicillin-binding protein 1A